MTIKTTAAAALLIGAILALPQAATAGKPDRDPSEKDCPNEALETRCSVELDAAYMEIGLSSSAGDFISRRNPDKDAGTLKCKISGAEIKLYQGKDDEAAALVQKSIDKIWGLYAEGKLTWTGVERLDDKFSDALDCIVYP